MVTEIKTYNELKNTPRGLFFINQYKIEKKKKGAIKHDFICIPLLLGKGDLHSVLRIDLEALQSLLGRSSVAILVKLHERDVLSAGHKPHLFVAGESAR